MMRHRSARRAQTVTITMLTALLLYGCTLQGSSEGRSAEHPSVFVERVPDGDTVEADIQGKVERIRLIGIDAPELDQRPWGRKAKKYLQELIASSHWQVGIEYDIERRDKHDRVLAYLWSRDGRLINEEMVKGGYAVLFTIPPNVKHEDRFKAAQIVARENRAGIWEKGGLSQKPSDYRREHPRTQ